VNLYTWELFSRTTATYSSAKLLIDSGNASGSGVPRIFKSCQEFFAHRCNVFTFPKRRSTFEGLQGVGGGGRSVEERERERERWMGGGEMTVEDISSLKSGYPRNAALHHS
jgi:hypothetical protein